MNIHNKTRFTQYSIASIATSKNERKFLSRSHLSMLLCQAFLLLSYFLMVIYALAAEILDTNCFNKFAPRALHLSPRQDHGESQV